MSVSVSGARDQDVRSDGKEKRIEFTFADEIGNRCSFGAAANEFAEGGTRFIVGNFGEGGVELNAFAAAGFGKQDFGIEAGRIGTVLL